jgi:SAM-dependent methyltransferase
VSKAAGAATFRTSAEAYDRHVGRYGPALSRALLDEAGIASPMRALDVGCGPGALTQALVERLGAQAVCAVDPSEPFAAACRARLPDVDVRVAAAEELPHPDGAFDAVLSQLVVNFLTDAPEGVAEMRRVGRPGAVVASCVWDYAGEMTFLRAFWDAATALDPDRAGPLDEGRSMRWCSPAELESLWTTAGLAGVRTGALVVEADYDGLDDLWEPLERGVAPSGAYAASLDAAAQKRLRTEIGRRLGVGDRRFRLSARAWCVVGHVPGL